MKTNLKLVANNDVIQTRKPAALWQATPIRDLVPARALSTNSPGSNLPTTKPSYGLMALVVAMHIGGMVYLVNSKPTPPVVKPVTPMMVSLVSTPAPEPEPELVPLVEPQPVIKPVPKPVVKQKPIVKETPKPEPVVVEKPAIAEPVSAPEPPPVETAPAVEAKAPVVAEAPKVEPQPEPQIEPPKFGAAYLHNPAPAYPASSRRAGEQGRVLLRVLVSTNGSAETVDLEDSSGFEKLDDAAIKAVKKWRFIPAKRSSEAISAYVLVPVKFSLES
jgi:protein TonB